MTQSCSMPLPVIIVLVIWLGITIWGMISVIRSRPKMLTPPPKPGDFRIVELEDGRFAVQQYYGRSWNTPELAGPYIYDDCQKAKEWMYRCYKYTNRHDPIKKVIAICPK